MVIRSLLSSITKRDTCFNIFLKGKLEPAFVEHILAKQNVNLLFKYAELDNV